jgi:hypothetical protein
MTGVLTRLWLCLALATQCAAGPAVAMTKTTTHAPTHPHAPVHPPVTARHCTTHQVCIHETPGHHHCCAHCPVPSGRCGTLRPFGGGVGRLGRGGARHGQRAARPFERPPVVVGVGAAVAAVGAIGWAAHTTSRGAAAGCCAGRVGVSAAALPAAPPGPEPGPAGSSSDRGGDTPVSAAAAQLAQLGLGAWQ